MTFPAGGRFLKWEKDSFERASTSDFNANTIKCILYTDAWTGTANYTTDTGYGTAPWTSANGEVSDPGYTTGGATLTSCAVTSSGGVNTFTAANPTWTITNLVDVKGFVIHDSTSGLSICAYQFPTAQRASGGGVFTIPLSAGFLRYA